MNLLRQAIEHLLVVLRPDAVPLVDAFDFPDFVLNSTLGRYDGQVYSALWESAQENPLNTVKYLRCETMLKCIDGCYQRI